MLLHSLRTEEPAAIQSDPIGAETLIREVPSWAYDVHTREGRAAFKRFLQGTSETARWVFAHVPRDRRIKFVGSLVFGIESGLVRNRLRWPTADGLRELVDQGCGGRQGVASEILGLMRCDLSELNAVRAEVAHVR